MNKILIISKTDNDFSRLIKKIDGVEVTHIVPGSVAIEPGNFDSFVVLDWSKDIESDTELQKLISHGKPAFICTKPGVGSEDASLPSSTRFKRLVGTGMPESLADCRNYILDEQDNEHLPSSPDKNAIPILIYKENIMSHSQYKGNTDDCPAADYALWIENGNTIYCSFDISYFSKARFSPIHQWQMVISFICRIITGSDNPIKFTPSYTNNFLLGDITEKPEVFAKSMAWFQKAGLLIDNGKSGVYEGYATEIKSDGKQKKATEIRDDCCGEVMFSYFLDFLFTGNPQSKIISDNLSDFIFAEMFTDKPGSLLDGMMKWSLNASNICYQDDVARSIIPQMLKCRYSGDNRYLKECTRALEFLYKTTGTDGLRVTRTENQRLDESEITRLASQPAEYPSAHYTAYYHGALLLNSLMTGRQDFTDMGTKGLEAIMSVYPDTKRCQSETQELARLILPLSLMYEATGNPEHKSMLYNVTNDLLKFRHETGTYLEWDTGYQSRYSRTTGDECSILTENGDPVSDLLYTVNWLPMGYIIAYFITKDTKFLDLWTEITDFMANAQIISANTAIDGAWARGWDAELKEVFALPNDVGWGPWCIESGWTVAEIASGLALGLLKDDLLKFYN